MLLTNFVFINKILLTIQGNSKPQKIDGHTVQ